VSIKIGLFIFLLKVACGVMYPVLYTFKFIFLVMGSGSIVLGSIGALMSIKIKRLIGYSSIAQSGYLIISLGCNNLNGVIASIIYLLFYSFTLLLFFGIFLNINNFLTKKNLIYVNQLYSLFIYNKELSLYLVFTFVAMAAIPPFGNFIAKLYIYNACMEQDYFILLIILMLSSILSAYYYFNFIQQFIYIRLNNLKLFIFEGELSLLYFYRIILLFLVASSVNMFSLYNFVYVYSISCL